MDQQRRGINNKVANHDDKRLSECDDNHNNQITSDDNQNIEEINKKIEVALIENQVESVRSFLKTVDLEKFLTSKKLRELYEKKGIINEKPEKKRDLNEKKKSERTKDDDGQYGQYDQALIELINEVRPVQQNSNGKSNELLVYIGKVIRRFSRVQLGDIYKEPKGGSLIPERELFLWSVLLNRKDMARMFLEYGRDHIGGYMGGALIACAILKSLSERASDKDEIDLSINLLNNANEFEKLAVDVLNECYKKNRSKTHDLLVREMKTWGGTTLMDIANRAKLMDFMAHSACQTKLSLIWMGKMAFNTDTWKILTGLLFPFVLLKIIFLAKDTDVDKDTDEPKPANPPDKPGAPGDLPRVKKHVTVNCCTPKKNTIQFDKACNYFYTAPVVKFMSYTLSQLSYLILFSFFVLTNLRPATEVNSPSVAEYTIWGWTATLVVEELRQIISRNKSEHRNKCAQLKFKLASYLSSAWNKFDLLVYLVFLLSIILRYTLSEKDFIWVRVMYCISLSLFYIRFMHVFFVEKNIGPKVIMIKEMFKDLIFFFFILMVVILAYGVASQALRFPNQPASWDILKDVIYKPYWQMYGELFLEELEGDVGDCTNDTSMWGDPNMNRCPEKSWMIIAFFAIYMIMTNILLLNLLIAMFSYTFQRVQEKSEHVWRFYLYELYYEYVDRPAMPPPFITIIHLYRLYKYMCLKSTVKENTVFKISFRETYDEELRIFENNRMNEYLSNTPHYRKQENVNARVSTGGDRSEDNENILVPENRLRKLEDKIDSIMKILTSKTQGHGRGGK